MVLAAAVASKFGRDALGVYIISMTDGVSDCSVQLLLKLTGAQLPIAPCSKPSTTWTARRRSSRRFFPSGLWDAAFAIRPSAARDARLLRQQQGLRLSHGELALFRAQEAIAGSAGAGGARHALPRPRGSIARGGARRPRRSSRSRLDCATVASG